jgi:hypothetical protein
MCLYFARALTRSSISCARGWPYIDFNILILQAYSLLPEEKFPDKYFRRLLEKPVGTGSLAAFLLKRPKTRSFPVNYLLAGNWVTEPHDSTEAKPVLLACVADGARARWWQVDRLLATIF